MVERKTETEFNSSIASLQRLDDLLKDVNEWSRLAYNKDVNSMGVVISTLKQIHKEISPKLSKTEKEKSWGIYLEIKKLKSFKVKKMVEGGVKLYINKKTYMEYIDLLDKWEIYLRKLADSKGMLITDKKSMASQMDEDI